MRDAVQLISDIVRGKADPWALAIVAGVLALLGFVIFCCRFVPEGEQAAILSFGRFRKAVGPGFVIIGPPWRSLHRIHIRQTSLRLAPQSVLVRDGIVFNVVGVLIYRITDVRKALFEIADLQEALGDVGAGKLREVVSGRSSGEMWDVMGLRASILERLRDQEEQWGVGILDFLLTHVEPAGAAQQLFLLEELARRRVEAARILLEGFQKLGGEIKLPPKPDSPLWAALAGMSVTAATFPESASPVAPDGNGLADVTERLASMSGNLDSIGERLAQILDQSGPR